MSSRPTIIRTLSDACDAVAAMEAPALVGLRTSTQGWQLMSGGGFEDLDDLIGFCAPRSWDGVALVATGRARDLERPDAKFRIRLTYALLRDGSVASALTTAEGDQLELGEAAPGGRVEDYCRRILGLPTDEEPLQPADSSANSDWATWDELHAEVIADGERFFGLGPAQVGWFDPPSFGRYLLGLADIPSGHYQWAGRQPTGPC